MANLAEEMDLTKGTFYHHFESKEDVMKEALKMSCGWFERRVFSVAYQDELSQENRLESMIQLTYKAFTAEEGGCFFANTILETSHVEDTFLHILRNFFKKWEDALAYMLMVTYSESKAHEVAKQIIAEIEGSIVLMQLHQDKTILQNALQRLKKRLG